MNDNLDYWMNRTAAYLVEVVPNASSREVYIHGCTGLEEKKINKIYAYIEITVVIINSIYI